MSLSLRPEVSQCSSSPHEMTKEEVSCSRKNDRCLNFNVRASIMALFRGMEDPPYLVPPKEVAEEEKKDMATIETLTELPLDRPIFYITTKRAAIFFLRIVALSKIIGFDCEWRDRRNTIQEQHIISAVTAPGIRKAALLGWHIVERAMHSEFPVAWSHIGLRLIQIATEAMAIILDMPKIRAFPEELRQILLSEDIKKVGVALINDARVLWHDLRTDTKNLVDVGLMTRLAVAENPKITVPYVTLGLQTSVEKLLGHTIEKTLGASEWKNDILTDDQLRYAALDAIASLKVYEKAFAMLQARNPPVRWYTFNTIMGEAVRMKRASDGSVVPWKTSDCTWWSGDKFVGYD